MSVNFTKCFYCQGTADLTAENDDEGEPQCLKCTIRITAIFYHGRREKSKEQAEAVLQGLKDRFPWEPVQELFDEQVLQLASDSEFQEMVLRNIDNPVPDRPGEWMPPPPTEELPPAMLDEMVEDGILETKISQGVRVYRLSKHPN